MGPTKKQLQGTYSDNLRVLWAGTVAEQRVRITRNERLDLRNGGAIILQMEGDGRWWMADGGDIEPDALLAALMEAGKLKF